MRLFRSGRPSRSRRLVSLAAVVVAATSVSVVAASPAQAATQKVTIATAVNGVAGGPAYTGTSTSVAFTVTNGSTNGSKLGVFSIVVPPGVGKVSKGAVSSSSWTESVISCGIVPSCSAIVLVGAKSSSSAIGSGGSITASIGFTAPSSPKTLSFPFIGIGNGVFTATSTPRVSVISGAPASFDVSVAPTVSAGTSTGIQVTARNAAGQVVPFAGGSVTVQLAHGDAGASVSGTGVSGGTSATVSVGAAPSGAFTIPAVFTKAQTQGVSVSSGAATGTSNAFTVTSGTAASLTLVSITDTSSTPALPTPAAGQQFAVAYRIVDGWGNPVAGVSVSLSADNGSGVLTAGSSTSAADGTGTIAATYSTAQTGLQLRVTAGALTDTATTNVVTAGDSTTATPNVPTSLNAGIAAANLPNGANGDVFLTTAPCTGTGCGQVSTETTLEGTFKVGGTALYTFAKPASVTLTCATACPFKGKSSLTGKDRQESDFKSYPVQVSLLVGGVYQPFKTATSCRVLSGHDKWAKPRGVIYGGSHGGDSSGGVGQIVNPAAQADGFCVDVYAITRTGTGSKTLNIPVLFVEDPKMRGP